MKKLYYILICLIFICQNILAQTDVIHYNLHVNMQNIASKSISATANLQFMVKQPTNTVKLDLLKLTVSSVLNSKGNLNFTQNDSILTISFVEPILPTDTQEITINYQGNPVADAQWGGFYFSGNYAFNMGVAFASVPHNFGRCWYPCIDNFTDRATYQFNITTDTGFVAVCNGLMQPKTINGSSVTWHWNLTEPIPTYLANVAVGKYHLLTDTYIDKLGKQIPVVIAASATDTANVKLSMVNLKNAVSCFEDKFGPFPFSRIGYVCVPFNSGAMEHATNISYPIYAVNGSLNYETLMAHELSHMWWGNMATCATSSDMWLNEGWASFSEAVFLECLYGKTDYYNELYGNLFDVYRSAHVRDGGFKAVSGVTEDITYGTHVYKKGSLVAHNLKTLMGDDNFYSACKWYLNNYKFKDVTSANLRDAFQQFTSHNLTDFFNNWVFDKGNYNVVISNFKVSNNTLNISLKHQKKHAQQFVKYLPVVLQVYNNNLLVQNIPLIMRNGTLDTVLTFNQNFTPAFATINFKNGYALAKTTDIETIKTTGLKNFGTTLFSITTKTIQDSVVVMVEHNFTAPNQWEVADRNVRISPERYWRVDGIFSDGFSATAFINYDGSKPPSKNGGYLDNELFEYKNNEDSLVLLYRSTADTLWQIHTDHVFQPGGSKTDFIGRFWVNNLKRGEYAFGIKDATTAVKKNEINNQQLVNLYPNPAKGVLNIELKQFATTEFAIYNVAGKQIQTGILKQQNTQLNIENLPKGIYIFTTSINKNNISLRFLVD